METFKLSRDPFFVEKVRDVVGLYLNPPDKALVLSVDEKSQIQALGSDCPPLAFASGSSSPSIPGEYKRHGTTTLFAALRLLDGKVIGECLPRDRGEFIRFLKKMDHETPAGLNLNLIVDNFSTHKSPPVKRWLKRHLRFHLHFIPASSRGSIWWSAGLARSLASEFVEGLSPASGN